MRIIKLTTLLLTFLIIGSSYSQSKKFKELFDESFKLLSDDNYIKALPILQEMERMDPKNNNTLFSIGYCYLNSRYDKALSIPYFEKVLSHKKPVSNTYRTGNYKEKKAPIEVIKYLGEAYHFDYQFEKAMENYLMYKDVLSENNTKFLKDINRKIEITKNAQSLIAAPVAVNVSPLDAINTIYPEYRPKVTGNEMKMYFTSRRLSGDKAVQDDQGLYFEDIFFSEKINGQWTDAKMMDDGINSVGHDACLYISPDENYMIIYKANSGAVTYGSIFETYLKNGKWSEPTLMIGDVNSSNWQTDVNLSSDGKTMFYTSDRPGGQGGRDLWMIKKLPTGEWGKSQNMGKNLNTQYDEEAPYLHPDGKTFYFSSQGHNTMGGYDIFKSELQEDGSWGAPINLGYPANTTGDDVFFFPTNDGKRVYFSSFRKDGKGDQDIYIVEFPNNEEKTLAVYQGVAKDTKGEVLKDLVITVYNPDGDIAGEYRPNDQTGRYLFILQPGQTYDIEYNDKGALGKDQVIVAATGGVKDIIKVATKENDKITIASGEIVDGEILALINTENPDNVEITNIDITVNTKDPKEPVDGGDNKDPFKPVVTEYASQNDMMKDLYFIYDRTKIIEKSVADYNRTLQYLKDNPKVKVVIEGHTDANGSDEYNMWLASARSNKIKNMLNQDGISWSRMTTKNYGESKPIAPNMNPDGTDNPEGRQLNRRVSFAETAQQMASETEIKVEEEEVITISVGGQNIANVSSNSSQNYTVFEFGEDDVVFKVQLGAFRKKIDETKFDNAEEVGFYKGNDNLYKYFSGTFLSKSMADEHRKRMAAEGYPDAFIVYFKEGKRLSTEEIARLFPDNDCNTLIETATEK